MAESIRQQFILEVLAKVDSAASPIQQLEQLLRIISKPALINVSSSGSEQAIADAIMEIAQGAELSAETVGRLSTAIKRVSSNVPGSVFAKSRDDTLSFSNSVVETTRRLQDLVFSARETAQTRVLGDDNVNAMKNWGEKVASAVTNAMKLRGVLESLNYETAGKMGKKDMFWVLDLTDTVAGLDREASKVKGIIDGKVVRPVKEAQEIVSKGDYLRTQPATSRDYTTFDAQARGYLKTVKLINDELIALGKKKVSVWTQEDLNRAKAADRSLKEFMSTYALFANPLRTNSFVEDLGTRSPRALKTLEGILRGVEAVLNKAVQRAQAFAIEEIKIADTAKTVEAAVTKSVKTQPRSPYEKLKKDAYLLGSEIGKLEKQIIRLSRKRWWEPGEAAAAGAAYSKLTELIRKADEERAKFHRSKKVKSLIEDDPAKYDYLLKKIMKNKDALDELAKRAGNFEERMRKALDGSITRLATLATKVKTVDLKRIDENSKSAYINIDNLGKRADTLAGKLKKLSEQKTFSADDITSIKEMNKQLKQMRAQMASTTVAPFAEAKRYLAMQKELDAVYGKLKDLRILEKKYDKNPSLAGTGEAEEVKREIAALTKIRNELKIEMQKLGPRGLEAVRSIAATTQEKLLATRDLLRELAQRAGLIKQKTGGEETGSAMARIRAAAGKGANEEKAATDALAASEENLAKASGDAATAQGTVASAMARVRAAAGSAGQSTGDLVRSTMSAIDAVRQMTTGVQPAAGTSILNVTQIQKELAAITSMINKAANSLEALGSKKALNPEDKKELLAIVQRIDQAKAKILEFKTALEEYGKSGGNKTILNTSTKVLADLTAEAEKYSAEATALAEKNKVVAQSTNNAAGSLKKFKDSIKSAAEATKNVDPVGIKTASSEINKLNFAINRLQSGMDSLSKKESFTDKDNERISRYTSRIEELRIKMAALRAAIDAGKAAGFFEGGDKAEKLKELENRYASLGSALTKASSTLTELGKKAGITSTETVVASEKITEAAKAITKPSGAADDSILRPKQLLKQINEIIFSINRLKSFIESLSTRTPFGKEEAEKLAGYRQQLDALQARAKSLEPSLAKLEETGLAGKKSAQRIQEARTKYNDLMGTIKEASKLAATIKAPDATAAKAEEVKVIKEKTAETKKETQATLEGAKAAQEQTKVTKEKTKSISDAAKAIREAASAAKESTTATKANTEAQKTNIEKAREARTTKLAAAKAEKEKAEVEAKAARDVAINLELRRKMVMGEFVAEKALEEIQRKRETTQSRLIASTEAFLGLDPSGAGLAPFLSPATGLARSMDAFGTAAKRATLLSMDSLKTLNTSVWETAAVIDKGLVVSLQKTGQIDLNTILDKLKVLRAGVENAYMALQYDPSLSGAGVIGYLTAAQAKLKETGGALETFGQLLRANVGGKALLGVRGADVMSLYGAGAEEMSWAWKSVGESFDRTAERSYVLEERFKRLGDTTKQINSILEFTNAYKAQMSFVSLTQSLAVLMNLMQSKGSVLTSGQLATLGQFAQGIADQLVGLEPRIQEITATQKAFVQSLIDTTNVSAKMYGVMDTEAQKFYEQMKQLVQRERDYARAKRDSIAAQLEIVNGAKGDAGVLAGDQTQVARLHTLLQIMDEISAREKEDIAAKDDAIRGIQKLSAAYSQLRSALFSGKLATEDAIAQFQLLSGVQIASGTAEERRAALLRALSHEMQFLASASKEAAQFGQRLANANQAGAAQMAAMTDKTANFNRMLGIAVEKIIRYRFAFTAMQRALTMIGSTLALPKQVEVDFVKIDKVLTGTGANMMQLKKYAFEMSSATGMAIKDVAEVMLTWAQQGYSQVEVQKLTTSALLGSLAANLEAKDAVEVLTAAIRIYNMTAEESITVFDKIVNVERKYAVTTKDLADAIKAIGVAGEEFSIGMDSLLGSVTAVGQVTRRTGSQVATALKTMYARFMDEEVVKQMSALGVGVYTVQGNIRSLDDTLDELAEKWKTLTEVQKLNLAKSVGNLRFYSQFLVLMDQYNVKLKAQLDAERAQGYTSQAAAKQLNTTANAVARMNENMKQFSVNVGESTFGYKTLLDGSTWFLEGLTRILSKAPIVSSTFAQITGALLTMASAYVVVRGSMIAYQTLVSRFAESLGPQLIAQLQAVGATAETMQAEVMAGNLTSVGALGMANILEEQMASVKQMSLTHKVGTVFAVKYGDGILYLQKTTAGLSNVAAAAANNVIALSKSEIEAAIASGALNKELLMGQAAGAGFMTRIKGLISAIGGLKIVIAIALVIAFAKLLSIHKEQNDAIKRLNESIKINVDNLLKMSDTSKKLAVSLLTDVAVFDSFAKKVGSLKEGTTEYAEAWGNLYSIFMRNRGLSPTLGTTKFEVGNLQTVKNVSTELLRLSKQQTEEAYRYNKIALGNAKLELAKLEEKKASLSELATILSDVYDMQAQVELVQLESGNNKDLANRVVTYRKMRDEVYNLNEALAVMKTDAFTDPRYKTQDLQFLQATTDSISVAADSLQASMQDSDRSVMKLTDRLVDFAENAYKGQDALKKMFPNDLDKIPLAKLKGVNAALSRLSTSLAKQGKVMDLRDVLQAAETNKDLNVLVSLMQLVGNGIADVNVEADKLAESIRKASTSVQTSVGLTVEELKKIKEDIAKKTAEATVDLKNMERDITESVNRSIAKGDSFNILEMQLSALEKITDKLREPAKELERQLEEYMATAAKAKSMSTSERNLAASKIVELQALVKKTEERIANAEGAAQDPKQRDYYTVKASEYRTELMKYKADLDALFTDFSGWMSEEQKLELIGQYLAAASKEAGGLSQALFYVNKAIEEGQKPRGREEELRRQIKNAEEYASLKTAEVDSRTKEILKQRAQIGLEVKRNDLIREQATLGSKAVSDYLNKMELGNDSITRLIDIQNVGIEYQNTVLKLVSSSVEGIVKKASDYSDIMTLASSNTSDLSEVLTKIEDILNRQGKNGTEYVRNLRLQLDFEKWKADKLATQLSRAKAIGDAIDDISDANKNYVKQQETIFDLQSDIVKLIGSKQDLADLEVRKQESLRQAHRDTLDITERSLQVMQQYGATGSVSIQNIMNKLKETQKLQASNIEVFGPKWVAALEQVRPELERANDTIKQMAEGVTSAFTGSTEIMLQRYQDIFDINLKIKTNQDEIVQLENARAGVLDTTSETYKDLTERIADSRRNLANLNHELDYTSSTSRMWGDIMQGFTSSLGQIFVDIQTQKLTESLTQVLNETGPGRAISNAILDGSQKGAREYATKLLEALKTLNIDTRNVFLSEGDIFIKKLNQAFIVGASLFTTAIGGGSPTMGPSGTGTPGVFNAASSGSLVDLVNLGDQLSGRGANKPKAPTENQPMPVSVVDPGPAPKETNAWLRTMQASLTLIASNIGMYVGVQAGGPGAAKNAAIGSQVGGLLGTGVAGMKAISGLTGFAGAFLGSAIPVVGSILGGLVGSLFTKKDTGPKVEIEPLKIQEENVKALKENTDAIKAVAVEFVDLRNELINAPSRFVMAPQPGLGYRTTNRVTTANGVQSAGNGVPSSGAVGGVVVNFHVQGNLDTAAADRIIKQMGEIYHIQSRTAGSTSNLFR